MAAIGNRLRGKVRRFARVALALSVVATGGALRGRLGDGQTRRAEPLPVDAALLHVPTAEGTWWHQGRTGALELTFHRGAVSGAASGAWLTDVGGKQRIVRGLVKGTVVQDRVRFIALMRPKQRGPEERWRFTGYIDPPRGWAEGTIDGTGSWQVSFEPITERAGFAVRAFREEIEAIRADRDPARQSKHYLAMRSQLNLYASWLAPEPDAASTEPAEAAQRRAAALGEMTRDQIAVLRAIWTYARRAPHALELCQSSLAEDRVCADALVRLWADPGFGSSLARDAGKLRLRLRQRADCCRRLLDTSEGEGSAETRQRR